MVEVICHKTQKIIFLTFYIFFFNWRRKTYDPDHSDLYTTCNRSKTFLERVLSQ